MTIDHAYSILGLQRGAAEQEIKSRFRILSKKYHPDTSDFSTFFEKARATRKFIRIKEAYDFLMRSDLSEEDFEPKPEPEQEERPKYNTQMPSSDPLNDKFFDKIGKSKWTEWIGMVYAISFMIYIIFAMPINVGLNYLFVKLGLEPDSHSVKSHFWRLMRFILSLALGSVFVYFYFINDAVLFVVIFLIGGSLFTIFELGSFIYFIYTLMRLRGAIVVHSRLTGTP